MIFNATLRESPPAEPDACLPPEIREAIALELDAICNEPQFRSSRRNCEFLRYVVTKTLSGRPSEIKERTLGTELFGRPASYDTGSDAVVRVRANDVRKRLACYYEEHESQAGWRIQLPLRTYVPQFLPETNLLAVEAETGRAAREPQTPVRPRRVLSLAQMMMPTLVALFLCAATFRWQIFSGTPYLDFWDTLLSGHSAISLVLDSDPADPRAVTIDDLRAIGPLLVTAASFHAETQVQSSAGPMPDRSQTVPIHITHSALPGPAEPAHDLDDPKAAYVLIVPGRQPEMWISSRDPETLGLAIGFVSSMDHFPYALEIALRRSAPSRIRISANHEITVQTAAMGGAPWSE